MIKIDKTIKDLNKKLYIIKKEGWHRTVRQDESGIGLTLEKLLGKTEDRNPYPDYFGIEIKTKCYSSKSYMTLFSLTPKNLSDKNIRETLRLSYKFGYPDKEFHEIKVLRTEIYADKPTLVSAKYFFKLNFKDDKVFILVHNFDFSFNEEITYWKIDELKKRIKQKMENLVIVNAYKKKENKIDYYKYYNYDFYKLKSPETFIELLRKGIIRVELKISVAKSGIKKGQVTDKGTSFEIKEEDIEKLFTKIS